MRDMKKIIKDEHPGLTFNENHSSLLYRTILETSMDGFWIVDSKGKILEVNDAYCKLIGYSREELLSMNVADIEDKESNSEVRPHIRQAMRSKSCLFETIHRCKNGKLIDIEVSTYTLKSDHNRIFSFFRDITERKKIENELKNSEARYHNLFDNANDAIFLMDYDKFIECNSKTLEIFDCTSDQIVGKKPYDPFSPKFQSDGLSSKEKAMEYINLAYDGQSQFFEWSHLKYDGTPFEAEVSLNPVRLDGKTYIQAIVRDITERKKARQELIQARENWENIFQAIGHPSFILNPEHKIISANRAAVKKSGLNLEQIIGKKCYVLLHRKRCHSKNCPMEKMLKTGRLETAEMEVEAFDGYYFVSCTPICNKEGHLEKVIHIATDITERKKIEEKLKEYQKQLKSLTSELSLAEERERRRIAEGLHDDIAQKLAIVKFGFDSLQTSLSKNNILSAIKRQNKLIEQTIEDVRTLTFELSNPLLYEIGIEAAVEAWLTDHIQGKCNIDSKFISEGPQIVLSEDIRIVLFQGARELLTNVLKYSNANSVEVYIKRNKHQIKISVKDDGIGFDLNKLDLPGSGKGGFGLFNIRERLEYLGGNIKIQSIPKHGTCVTMTVPIESVEKALLEEPSS